MQELNIAHSEGYREQLEQKREADHATMLTFVAIIYGIQRRAGRDATVELLGKLDLGAQRHSSP